MQHVYEGLVRYDKDFKIQPCLATGWQYVTPTQLRFSLRKNIKFHDGSPFTADDVVAHKAKGLADGQAVVGGH